jgi:hypothetical protein
LPKLRLNEVGVLAISLDEGSYKRADRDNVQILVARTVQRPADHSATDMATFNFARDLSVEKRESVANQVEIRESDVPVELGFKPALFVVTAEPRLVVCRGCHGWLVG